MFTDVFAQPSGASTGLALAPTVGRAAEAATRWMPLLLTCGAGLWLLGSAHAGDPHPGHPISQTAPARRAVQARPPAAASAVPQSATAHELSRWCQAITRQINLPQATCLRSELQAGEGRSVREMALWSRDILPADGMPKLRVLVVGGIHGDEKASVSLVFDWMQRAGQMPRQAVHWRMVPLLNPDGLLRKPATRTNARGVDLNRNFPTADWSRDAQRYWAQRTGKDPRRYPGPRAMSEPETRWLHAQIEQFKPQLIASIHAPYGLLDFDGPPPPPHKLGSLYLDQVGVFPGSLGNYGGLMLGVPVITVELKNAQRVSTVDTQAIWTDLMRWIDQRLLKPPALAAEAEPRDTEDR